MSCTTRAGILEWSVRSDHPLLVDEVPATGARTVADGLDTATAHPCLPSHGQHGLGHSSAPRSHHIGVDLVDSSYSGLRRRARSRWATLRLARRSVSTLIPTPCPRPVHVRLHKGASLCASIPPVAAHCTPVHRGCEIGLTGFEPATSPTRTERATKLRHSPNEPRLASSPQAPRKGGATLRAGSEAGEAACPFSAFSSS
jgi:hypothetical protein